MRLRHVKNAYEIVSENKDIVIENPKEYKGRWKELLNTNGSISLEVGCGKGKFLTENAIKFKENGYLGLEMMTSVICRATQKVKELELPNVKLINQDAINLLDLFDEGELDRIYVNFPDPWPKKRHEKRRLTSPSFLAKYKTLLKKDGVFRFKTDNLDLYNYSLETVIPTLKDGYNCGEVDYTNQEIIMTEFETKFKNQGNPIYYIEGIFKE